MVTLRHSDESCRRHSRFSSSTHNGSNFYVVFFLATMDALIRTIDTAIQSNDYSTLSTVFSGYGQGSWQSVGQGEQRSLASHFLQRALECQTFLPAAFEHIEDVMVIALGHLPATVEGAADSLLRQKLFDYKINADNADYSGAARILGDMRMDDDPTSVYYMEASKRTDVYVKIAECFLAEDQVAEADSAVQRAGSIVESIPNKEQHMALILRYKSTYARVLDNNRKFLQAAQRYHELSQSNVAQIDDEDLLQMLGMAATCAILAPSGPQRQRVLGHIYKDERLDKLESMETFATHSIILKKMHLFQILRPEELKIFEASLAEHQKAIMGDGLTIMERGVVEHNMISVSKLYRTIYVKELALILGVNDQKAEKIAASMIMEGSLHGSIDQVEGLLEFESDESPEQSWDRSITSFCMELNRVTDAIKAIE